jgi:hypothetical protein
MSIKVAIFGNCQAGVVAKCLQVLNDVLVIKGVPASASDKQIHDVAEWSDIIYAQDFDRCSNVIAPFKAKTIVFPRIIFQGFHPDSTDVKVGGTALHSPIGRYHSALCLLGWKSRLKPSEIATLYTPEVFDQLGYFDYWDISKELLLAEGNRSDVALDDLFLKWSAGGCFMHSVDHPKLEVLADLAEVLLNLADIPIFTERPQDYLTDIFVNFAVWPVYPAVGQRLRVRGNYQFKVAQGPNAAGAPTVHNLDHFIQRSLAIYGQHAPDALACPILETERFQAFAQNPLGRRQGHQGIRAADALRVNPYKGLQPYQYWHSAIETQAAEAVDPALGTNFVVPREAKVATAGSCFAQHISRALHEHGFNYYVAEPAPAGLTAEPAGYGVFSARYGNIYTARQLVQLFDRAVGDFLPEEDAWQRADGRFVDPFRPRVEPQGFASLQALDADRNRHLAAVRDMFESLDFLVFTLGLTEAWVSRIDGAVFPLAPGVVADGLDGKRHAFVNFSVADTIEDLEAFVDRLKACNRHAQVILTVSPVPLAATYEARHVLTATTYSKSVLRAAAEEVARHHPQVHYFPAYEIITGAFNRGRYFDHDLRSVTPEGVGHVMRLFMAHCESAGVQPDKPAAPPSQTSALAADLARSFEVICDEDAIRAVGL